MALNGHPVLEVEDLVIYSGTISGATVLVQEVSVLSHEFISVLSSDSVDVIPLEVCLLYRSIYIFLDYK